MSERSDFTTCKENVFFRVYLMPDIFLHFIISSKAVKRQHMFFCILFERDSCLQPLLNLHSAAQMFQQANQPKFLTVGRDGDCPHRSFKEHLKQTAIQHSAGKDGAAFGLRTGDKAP